LPRHWRTAHHSRWVSQQGVWRSHDGPKLVQADAVFALGFVSAVQPKRCICPMYLAEWSYACCHGVQPGVSTRDEYCPCPLFPGTVRGLVVCQRHNYQCSNHSSCPYMLHVTCYLCLCVLAGVRGRSRWQTG
jgi:hypothetical protein